MRLPEPIVYCVLHIQKVHAIRNTQSSFLLFLAAILFTCSLVACSKPDLVCEDSLGCIEIAANDPVRLATLLATSGAAESLGNDSLGGVEIAIDERNGELLGHQIELTNADSGCLAEQAIGAAETLTAVSNIIGIIGPTCSTAAAAIIPIINAANNVMLSPSSTATNLTTTDSATGGVWQPGFFRTAHNELWQGVAAAKFATSYLGATTAVIIYDERIYPFDGVPTSFAAAFEELGGAIIMQQAILPGQTTFSEQLSSIETIMPDILYLALLEPEARLLLGDLADHDVIDNISLLGTDSLLVPGFMTQGETAVPNFYVAGPAVSGSAYNQFLELWQFKYSDTPNSFYHAHAYDATNLLLDAIETSAQVGKNNSLLIGRQALRDALTNTTAFPGLTGTLNCQAFGECASGEALGIYRITETAVDQSNWPPDLFWMP